MDSIQEYYKNTENALPHELTKEFIALGIQPSKGIELGTGAGRDSIYLIKNGWDMTCIDKENTEDLIKSKLSFSEIDKFNFKVATFEDLELYKNKLILANYSLPFCNKYKFEKVWNRIVESIEIDGYFVGNFFGINDSWKSIKEKMTFLEEKEVRELFNSFEIIKFEELEKDGKTGMGKIKHWHIYNVIARKIK